MLRAFGRPIERPQLQATTFIGFTGPRGVVSLAAALSVPLMVAGQPFPERQLILFVTFTVIMVTLFGQGLTLPWVIARLGLDRLGDEQAEAQKTDEMIARIAGVRAALDAIDALARSGAPRRAMTSLRRRHEDRLKELIGTADDHVSGSPVLEEATLQA